MKKEKASRNKFVLHKLGVQQNSHYVLDCFTTFAMTEHYVGDGESQRRFAPLIATCRYCEGVARSNPFYFQEFCCTPHKFKRIKDLFTLITTDELLDLQVIYRLLFSLTGVTKRLHSELLLKPLLNPKVTKCNQHVKPQWSAWLLTPF